MRALRRASSLFPSLLVLATACASRDDNAVRVSIAPSLVFPRGALDGVVTLNLTVYEQTDGVGCDAATGAATGVTDATTKTASTQLGNTGCTGTTKFCGPISVSKSDATRIFYAEALDGGSHVLARGCATAQVNQDTLSLAIKMIRTVVPAVCGNGTIEATEQCEPANSAICDASCQTKELRLSDGVTQPSGPASFYWPAQSGDAGRFFAFFTSAFSSQTDIAMRLMSDALTPLAQPPAATTALLMPVDPAAQDFPPKPPAAANDQSQPAATFAGNLSWVAFTDTDNGSPDIHLRSIDSSLAPQQAAAIGINGSTPGTEAGIQRAPSIAAGNGVLYVAWQDETDGQVRGRTYTPGAGLGTQNQISSGTQNKNVHVAPTSSGWIAVWESGADIKLRTIGSNGTPSGAEVTVNDASLHRGAQDSPSVAVLADGHICVAWADHGTASGADIFVQRYDRDLNKVAGDQAVRINDVVSGGDQVAPAVAGTAAAGGAFVVAWLDAASGHVRARILGAAGGFLFNNVDGQASEFQVSRTDSHVRASPVVAIGGATSSIAIGWEDQTSGSTGIYARRFPAPQP